MGIINNINQSTPGLLKFGSFDFAKIPINKHKNISNNLVKILKNEIIDWCKENIKGYNVSFEIDENKNLIITGNCYINDPTLTKLPYKIHKVIGNFSACGGVDEPRIMHLQTLENFPTIVTGNFHIGSNVDLTSLVGGPEEVGGYYRCSGCKLKSLDGIAKKVGSYISAFSNHSLTDINALAESTFRYIDLDFCSNEVINTPTYKKLKDNNKIRIRIL